jgi:hypothetical protein
MLSNTHCQLTRELERAKPRASTLLFYSFTHSGAATASKGIASPYRQSVNLLPCALSRNPRLSLLRLDAYPTRVTTAAVPADNVAFYTPYLSSGAPLQV